MEYNQTEDKAKYIMTSTKENITDAQAVRSVPK